MSYSILLHSNYFKKNHMQSLKEFSLEIKNIAGELHQNNFSVKYSKDFNNLLLIKRNKTPNNDPHINIEYFPMKNRFVINKNGLVKEFFSSSVVLDYLKNS